MPALTLANLVAYCLQVASIVGIGAGLAGILRVSAPRVKLACWRVLLACCLVLPFVQPLAPLSVRVDEAVPAVAGEPSMAVATIADGTAPGTPVRARPLPLGLLVAAVLAAGAAVRLLWIGAGLVTLGRLRRLAPLLAPRPKGVDDASALAGADAEFRLTSAIARPVTFGAARPAVLLPDSFTSFSEDEQRAIACHELVHVKRRDWLRTIGDEIVRSVFWFHPAIWWLIEQIRVASEQVVDQDVVEITGVRQPYLDALVRLASVPPRLSLRPVSLLLCRSHLRERVTLLLKKEVSMSRARLVASLLTMAVVLVAGGTLVVTAIPLQGNVTSPPPAAPLGEQASIAPPALPTVMALADTGQAQTPVRTATGQGTQTAQKPGSIRPGEPTAPPQLPQQGASTPARIFSVAPAFPAGAEPGTSGVVVVALTIDAGGLVSDVAVVRGDPVFAQAVVDAARQWRYQPPKVAPYRTTVAVHVVPPAAAGEPTARALRVGDAVQPPVKIKDVKPAYPEEAKAARVQGVVIVEARINEAGLVTEARVLRSIPLLDAAALEAVAGWQFTPTLLNGVPVPIIMTVTVNFVLDPTAGGQSAPGGAARSTAGPPDDAARVSEALKQARAASQAAMVVPPDAVRADGNIQAPRKIKDVRPVYPPEAVAAKAQGVVIVEALVGADGKVQRARILRSIPLFDQAALDAVSQWEFEPVVVDGQPRPCLVTLTVNFTLR